MEEKTAQTISEATAAATETKAETATNEAEFTDTPEAEAKADEAKDKTADETEKPKQTKAENAEYARARREAERKAEIETARINAIIEAVGENPWTHEPMKDADDVAEYLTMKDIAKDGGDPVSDYAKHVKEKAKAEKAEAEAKEQQRTKANEDIADFKAKHADVDLTALLADEDFQDYADGKIGTKSLADIYDGYQKFIKKQASNTKREIAQKAANAKATPGALGNNADAQTFITRDEAAKMSKEDIKRNYDVIMASMKKW